MISISSLSSLAKEYHTNMNYLKDTIAELKLKRLAFSGGKRAEIEQQIQSLYHIYLETRCTWIYLKNYYKKEEDI